MTVLRALADLYGKQVCYYTNTANRFSTYNIAVYLYCYLDGIRCIWMIDPHTNNFWGFLLGRVGEGGGGCGTCRGVESHP